MENAASRAVEEQGAAFAFASTTFQRSGNVLEVQR